MPDLREYGEGNEEKGNPEMKFRIFTHTDRAEWLQWRHDGIGSSDAPVIMGVSRFKKPEQLLAEKTEPIAAENAENGYIKHRGNKIEQYVRKFYEDEMGMEFPELSCKNIELPFMKATLDGADDGYNLMIEIKLLSSLRYGKKYDKKPAGLVKWEQAKNSGKIPDDYYPQIQHQLAVTGMECCVFLGLKELKGQNKYSWDNIAAVSVMRDEKYIQRLTEAEKIFWDKVLTNRSKNEKVGG